MEPLESSADRRAKYVPNMDAAALGYGNRHRDHSRYLASSDADRMPSAAMLMQQRAKEIDQEARRQAAGERQHGDFMSASSIATSFHHSVRLHTSVPGTSFGAARRTTDAQDKPTQYDKVGKPILIPVGIGYGTCRSPFCTSALPRMTAPLAHVFDYLSLVFCTGHTHHDHYVAVASKRPEDVKRNPSTTLSLNSWL
jgi:hypothetical protein